MSLFTLNGLGLMTGIMLMGYGFFRLYKKEKEDDIVFYCTLSGIVVFVHYLTVFKLNL